MAVSIAQQLAKDKYRKEKRDQMTVEIPKGKREVYKQIAADLGISLALLVQFSVEDYGRNHGSENALSIGAEESERFSAADRKLVEEFNQLPADTQKAITKLIATINQNLKGGVRDD